MGGGYISLHRKLLEWEWYSDINTCRLFLHILLKANYKPTKWQGDDIGIGQLPTSFSTLSKETGLTIRSVRTSIEKLKKTGEVTCKTTNKYTLVTVENWAFYQNQKEETTSKTTNDRQAKRHKNDTQNDKQNDKQIPLQPEASSDFADKQNDKQNVTKTTRKTTTLKEYNKLINKDNLYIPEAKTPYGELMKVMLTDAEYDKLVARLGKQRTDEMIDRLDLYISSKGVKYKDHYATILTWDKKDSNQQPVQFKQEYKPIKPKVDIPFYGQAKKAVE